MKLHAVMAFAALLLLVRAVSADEVYLKDGRVLEGTVTPVENGDGAIDVRTGVGSIVVVQHFAGDQVDKVVYGRSVRQNKIDDIAKQRDALTDDSDAAACWDLAEQARTAGDQVLYRELALETLVRDRQHDQARKALGLAVVRGICMRPNEAAVANGMVSLNGHWMSWADREESVQLQAQREEKEQTRRKEIEDRRAARAAAQAAYDSLVDPYSSFDVPSSRPASTAPRVIYWQSSNLYCPPPVTSGGGLSVQASGGNKHTQWSFSWGG